MRVYLYMLLLPLSEWKLWETLFVLFTGELLILKEAESNKYFWTSECVSIETHEQELGLFVCKYLLKKC